MANLVGAKATMEQLLQLLKEAVIALDRAKMARQEAREAVDRQYGPVIEAAEARVLAVTQSLKNQTTNFLEALLPKGSKTLKLNGGSIQLRQLPESIEVTNKEELFASLKAHHAFRRCVRLVPSLDLNAIKRLPFFDKIRGVRKVGGTSTIVNVDGIEQPIRL